MPATSIIDKLPNPYTQLAWLPPTIAGQAAITNNVVVGSCAVLIWDMLDNMRKDYTLLTKHRISLPTIVYFIARIGALGFALSSAVYVSARLEGDCTKYAKVVGAWYPIAISAAALLFLFRLRAVFNSNRLVTSAFGFLWLLGFIANIIFVTGLTGQRITPVGYCAPHEIRETGIAPVIISLLYDTLVVVSISYKLMTNTHVDGIRTGIRTMIRGDYLPSFSKALLQDAQLYYMITLPVNLLAVVAYLTGHIPSVIRAMLLIPHTVLLSIMACRVFRNTKLGLLQDSRNTTEIGSTRTDIPLAFKSPGATTTAFNHTGSDTLHQSAKVNIQISQSVDREPSLAEIESQSHKASL